MSQEEAENKSDEKDKKEDRPPPARWPWILGGLVVVTFVIVVLVRIYSPRPDVWTDDAYVSVHYASISPRVSGHVVSVPVDNDQVVHVGDVLMVLDPSDYEIAVAMAEAAMERDTHQVVNASANAARQPALIIQQEAQVASAQAKLGFSLADQRRYAHLADTGAGTAQQRQQAETSAQQDRAALTSAQAALDASRTQLDVLRAQTSSAESTVKSDRAQLDQARLNLSYTRITSPVDGMVAQRTVQVGNNVAPGTTAMAVVPLDQVYIEANYREVELRHVRRGQHVTVHVDAYDINLDATVDDVPAASGAAFSPIPPNNATGNFTKIVQRLPVRIIISSGQPLARLLRVGFSVETTIHTGLEDVVGEQLRSPDRPMAP